jgi:hypothetical protein
VVDGSANLVGFPCSFGLVLIVTNCALLDSI